MAEKSGRKVRVALIGIGVMGKKYAEMITAGEAESMVLSAVVVRRPEMLSWAEALENADGIKPTVYKNTEELFAHPEDYDAVLIVTPHKTHAEFAKRAFELGKNVLCDKPAGATIGQAMDMTAQAKECGLVYGMIFHQRRYPKYRKIKEILEKKELGALQRVMLVNSRYFRTEYYHKSGSWRSSWQGEGGGVLINQGAHLLDIWQWLFGMPETIYADVPFGKYNDFMVDDEATVQMRYADGMTGTFFLTTGEAVWEERLEIIGSKGKILLENDTLHVWHYSQDILEYMKTEQVTTRENLTIEEEVISFEKAKEPYQELLENFARAVLDGGETALIAPGEDALNQIMLTNAAYYSAWKEGVVTLPVDREAYDEELEKRCIEERKKEKRFT